MRGEEKAEDSGGVVQWLSVGEEEALLWVMNVVSISPVACRGKRTQKLPFTVGSAGEAPPLSRATEAVQWHCPGGGSSEAFSEPSLPKDLQECC